MKVRGQRSKVKGDEALAESPGEARRSQAEVGEDGAKVTGDRAKGKGRRAARSRSQPAEAVRRRWVLVLVIGLLSVRASYGGEIIRDTTYAGQKTTISWAFWGGERTVQLYRRVCEEFVRQHPEIAIDVSIYPWGQYWAKLQTQAASGLAPDVISMFSTASGVWIAHGALRPLDAFVDSSGFDLSNYYTGAVENFRWDGQLYAIPLELDVRALVYSIDRLEEIGIPPEEWPRPDESMPWDEYEALIGRLTLRDAQANITQYGLGSGYGEWNITMLSMYGGDFVDRRVDPTRSTVEGNEALIAGVVKHLQQQYAERYQASTSVVKTAEYGGDYVLRSPRFATAFLGPWSLQGLKEAGVRFGLTQIPHATVPTQGMSVNAVGVYTESEHPDEAWTFIEFLASLEAQSLIGKTLRGVPAHKGARQAFVDNEYGIPQTEAYFAYLDVAEPVMSFSSTYVERAITTWLERLDSYIDNEARIRLRALQDRHEVVSEAAYQQHVSDMQAFIEETVREWVVQLDADLKEGFRRAEQPPGTKMARVVVPIMIIVFLTGCFLAYVFWIRRRETGIGETGKTTNWSAYLCLSPWLVGFLFFTLGPIIASIGLSFTEWNMIRNPIWVGAEHYLNLFNDRYFTLGLRKTFTYAAFVIPISTIGGIFTAGLLTSNVRGADSFKAIFYFPSLFTGAAAAVLWVNMFHREYGVVNKILSWFGVLPINWLDEQHAFITVVLMNIFWIGGATIIYYAGMKQIPRTLYEAAEIDGAGLFRRFVSVTLPMLSPVILFMVVMTTIGAFQVFTPALFFADFASRIGQPGDALRFYSVVIYDEAFNNLHMGKACAWAVILFVIIFLVTMVQFRLSKRYVHTEV